MRYERTRFRFERTRYAITCLCLWLVRRLNRSKDRCLSQVLFDLAEDYNTSPRTFNYAVEDQETTDEP